MKIRKNAKHPKSANNLEEDDENEEVLEEPEIELDF